jgi:hypothetical protein
MADKCVFHGTVKATTEVIPAERGTGEAVPLCSECATQYEQEQSQALPWREQIIHRRLLYYQEQRSEQNA